MTGLTAAPLTLVRWVDSAAQAGSWTDPDDLDDFGISRCRTIGHLIHEDDEQIWLVQTIDDTHGNVDAVFAIPRCAIVEQVRLDRAPG